jgi:hypothetical protein
MKFGKAVALNLFAIVALSGALPAHAGPYADDMSKCLVQATTPADRGVFIKWMFSAMALNPEVESMAKISETQREQMNQAAAGLFQKLLLVSCKTQTQQAVRYEGPQTIGQAFNVFGQVAGRELFANPRVAEGMGGLMKYVDESKLNELVNESSVKR